MYNILIIGYGVVGHNLYKELEKLHPDIYDKYKTEYNTKRDIKYDFAFICVDTPLTETLGCNDAAVQEALDENNANIFIIKSTILPRQAAYYTRYDNIVVSPEYYGGTQHCNNFEFNFTILGGNKESCYKVQQMMQEVYDSRHTFHITDAKTAMLTKYMENSWLATKVSFCCQFYDIAEKLGVNYEELRELFILDPRVNPAHTFVYDEHPYWKSHCLDKDVPAIANSEDAELLKAVINFNSKRR